MVCPVSVKGVDTNKMNDLMVCVSQNCLIKIFQCQNELYSLERHMVIVVGQTHKKTSVISVKIT